MLTERTLKKALLRDGDMERMAGGQDTWARWKSAVLSLPPTQSQSYLRDVEGFGPEQIRRLLRGEDATILPSDWAVTEESKRAMARYEAWERGVAANDGGAAVLDYQESRAAALPHQLQVRQSNLSTDSADDKEKS